MMSSSEKYLYVPKTETVMKLKHARPLENQRPSHRVRQKDTNDGRLAQQNPFHPIEFKSESPVSLLRVRCSQVILT